jgi:hypothetical protein
MCSLFLCRAAADALSATEIESLKSRNPKAAFNRKQPTINSTLLTYGVVFVEGLGSTWELGCEDLVLDATGIDHE